MIERSIQLSGTPVVAVKMGRENLRIQRGEPGEVRISLRSGDDLETWESHDGQIQVALGANATLTLPEEAHVTVERVLGNLRVEGIRGAVAAEDIHGNATLRAVGSTRMERVLGNLRVREASGDLTAEDVRGNVSARGVEGALALGAVGGNLEAEGVEGGLTAEEVRGNVSLRPPFSPGSTYAVNGFGNLRAWLPEEASVRLSLRAGGGLDVLHPGLELERRDGEAVGTLGAGAAALEADVRGNVMLLAIEPGVGEREGSPWEDLGARIEWQVQDALAKMAAHLEERLRRADGEWVRRGFDTATVEARRRAEQAAERARMRAEQAERRWRRAAGERVEPQAAQPSDEERLRVLRMVEDGKITTEQAADLLRAIEGK